MIYLKLLGESDYIEYQVIIEDEELWGRIVGKKEYICMGVTEERPFVSINSNRQRSLEDFKSLHP